MGEPSQRDRRKGAVVTMASDRWDDVDERVSEIADRGRRLRGSVVLSVPRPWGEELVDLESSLSQAGEVLAPRAPAASPPRGAAMLDGGAPRSGGRGRASRSHGPS
ncbi:MAG: hypothetical protein JW751_05340 [Polyangiaceae bacterium]|nr:hypothetical protein [Polyangiaceae bacterium]